MPNKLSHEESMELGRAYVLALDAEYTQPIYEVIKLITKHKLLEKAPIDSVLFGSLTRNPDQQQIL